MQKSVQLIKDKILNTQEIIELKKLELKYYFEELHSVLKTEYPLESFIGKPYQRHRSKWGRFDPEKDTVIFKQSTCSSYSHLQIHDILSGADLNLMLSTEFFISHNEYALFVEYDFDSQEEDTPHSEKWIYEYLILPI